MDILIGNIVLIDLYDSRTRGGITCNRIVSENSGGNLQLNTYDIIQYIPRQYYTLQTININRNNCTYRIN